MINVLLIMKYVWINKIRIINSFYKLFSLFDILRKNYFLFYYKFYSDILRIIFRCAIILLNLFRDILI